MTQTTYYEFNKPEGSDLVNPLVDTNPNWDALDADLHELNERSIANCTEVVSLGVHTISRLDTTAKFLKWIATANFTAGETFTVDGLPVAASTPAGATLATNAYVTGSVVLACLNADNTAMTIFVSGTTVASDAERLGGELPSYYGTASDVADNATDITNLQNQVGNTSIVGIGDGTCTGAIDALNTDLSTIKTFSTTERVVGKWVDGSDVYEKTYTGITLSANQVIDSSLTSANSFIVDIFGSVTIGNVCDIIPFSRNTGVEYTYMFDLKSNGLNAMIANMGASTHYNITVRYVKIS
jgi:hypothetical protein